MTSQQQEESSYFARERDRLAAEIASGFEELLSSTNQLNRKVEGVLGMTQEYETIAELWQSFQDLMRGRTSDHAFPDQEQTQGLPGTGGHVLAADSTEEHAE